MFRKTSKLLIAAIAALALLASVAGAANVAARGPARGITLKRFASVLSLTQEQTTEVRGILTTLRQDAKGVIASGKTRDEKRTELLKLREQARTSVNSVLTIDQKEKADEKNLVGRLLMPRKAGAAIRQALAGLNLSADQKTQIRGIIKDAGARARAIRQDTSLTGQDKMAKLRENRRGAIQSISSGLTPDQRAKFRQWLRNHRPGAPNAA